MKKNKESKITLVGAGPGDPDLITRKGLKAIYTADVILYDALVNPVLLEDAPEDTLKVYVGKRAGKHSYSQEEINMLLVQYAFSYGHVVRLKGGDPFVFGRGHEELKYAAKYQIKVDIVPGISSCIAVPELQQIPLTCRGVNESFWVMTGTTKKGKLSNDISIAAQSTATVVILMGMRRLEKITQIFSLEGKDDLPAMVIQSGSTNHEKFVIGTVRTIFNQAKEAAIGRPGIIIIGKVVGLHPEFITTNIKSLSQAF